jgi:hypothetical protein
MDEQLRRRVARVAGEVEAIEGAPGLTLPQMVVQPGSPIDITWTAAAAATVTSRKMSCDHTSAADGALFFQH